MQRGPTTLVVEDHPHMRGILRPLLRHALRTDLILDARDGMQALELMKNHSIDLMLVDLVLPTLSGGELIQLVRRSADSRNPTVPILVLSAHSTEAMARMARDAGANAFLAKPITADRLFRSLRWVLMDERPFIRSGNFCGPDRRRPPKPDDRPYQGPRRRASDKQPAPEMPAKPAAEENDYTFYEKTR